MGHREVPGRPELLGSTREFLDYFSLKSLDNLPTLAQLRDVENLGVQLEFPETQAPLVANDAAVADEPAVVEADPVVVLETSEVPDDAAGEVI